jgi:four helix bundle protein
MKKELIDGNPLLRLSFDFSVTIIAYCEQIEELKKYVLARQLMRSGTSVGANSMEAQNAESKADFIHKIKVAAKEADETQYWLLLCQRAHCFGYPDCSELLSKLDEIQKLLCAIVTTSKSR